MKRFHVHVAVPDLQESIRFYSAMFGTQPTVVKPDYAKWMLEDPRVNFAISQRGGEPGVNHLGFQADDGDELEAIRAHLDQAAAQVVQERDVACCYARSDKYWVTDPAGVPWETFHSLGNVPFYGAAADESAAACGTSEGSGCCPTKKPASACCA